MNERLLIAMVKNHPILYDRYRADFRDAIKRAKAWNVISKTFNVSVEDCMRTWRNIRERYAKELKVSKYTLDDGSEHESKWNLFDSLSFVQPYIKPRLKQGLLGPGWANTTNESLLIEQVKKYPALYDKQSEDFKNATLKESAWNSIAEVLSMSAVECMRMWRNIRERYAKQLKLVKTNGEYSPRESSKWSLFAKLTFLEPHIKPRNRVFTKLKPPNKSSMSYTDSSEDNTSFLLKHGEIHHKVEDPLYTEEDEEMQELDNYEEPLQSTTVVAEQPVQEYIMMPASNEQESSQTIIHNSFEETSRCISTKNQFTNSDLAFGNYIGQYLSEIVDTKRKNKLKISIVKLLHGDDT